MLRGRDRAKCASPAAGAEASLRVLLRALRAGFARYGTPAVLALLLAGTTPAARADSTQSASGDTVSGRTGVEDATDEATTLAPVERLHPEDSLQLRPLRPNAPRPRTQHAFGVGEEIVYEIRFGVVSAGTAVMAVEDLTEIDNRPAYHLTSRAWSNKMFSLVHKVNDHVDSWMDRQFLRSLGFRKRVHEGDYDKDEKVRFDYRTHLATYDDGSEFEIGSRVQDMLSAVYYLRTLDIEVGRPIMIEAHDSGKNYPLEVRVYGEERIETPAGEFDCLLVEPVMQSAGLFRRQGRLFIWITKDERKIPVRMRSKIVVGSVTVDMIEYRPGQPSLAEEPHTGAGDAPDSGGSPASFSFRD